MLSLEERGAYLQSQQHEQQQSTLEELEHYQTTIGEFKAQMDE